MSGGNKKNVHAVTPFSKEVSLSTIGKRWIHFDKEYCFRLMKLMSKIIKDVIKSPVGSTKYLFSFIDY